MDNSLIELLRFAKRSDAPVTWETVSAALSPLYGFELKLLDVVSIVLGVYEKSVCEPRFEMGDPSVLLRNLVLAPVKGFSSISFMGPSSITEKYSVEEFYNAILKQIISELRVSRSDWCADVLFPENKECKQ